MKKLLMLLAALAMIAAVACAEAPDALPTATPVPGVVAAPEGENRAAATPTPHPYDSPLPEDVFLANAIEISRRIDLLADSEAFIWNFAGGIDEAVLDKVTAGDHTWPRAMYAMDGHAMWAAMSAGAPEGSAALDLSRPEIRRDLVWPLSHMLVGQRPADESALIHLLSRYKVFACDRGEEFGAMFLMYDNAVPILLVWYSDAGAVAIAASFLPDDDLNACASAEEVSAWLTTRGLPQVAVEEVQYK